jgi:hypothetical protein
MSPDLFVQLVVEEDRRAGSAPTPSGLQRRLARLAALRLVRHELPQRSYLWWNRGEDLQPAGCLG